MTILHRLAGLNPVIACLSLAVVTSACSRPVTCALEGCVPNNGVQLASDEKGAGSSSDSRSDDAIPHQENELEKKIADILERLGLIEALTKLQDETMKMHEQRIVDLEDNSAAQDGVLTDILKKIDQQRILIDNNLTDIEELHFELHEQIDLLAASEAQARKKLADDIGVTVGDLRTSLAAVEDGLRGEMEEILTAMANERSRVDGEAAKLSADFTLKMNTLNTALSGEIATLKTSVGANTSNITEIFKAMAAERVRLDNAEITLRQDMATNMTALKNELLPRIVGLEASDVTTAQKLTQLSNKISGLDTKLTTSVFGVYLGIAVMHRLILDLQDDVRDLEKRDTKNFNFLNGKIGELRAELKAKTDLLDNFDSGLLNRIVSLENSNTTLRTDLNSLTKRFNDFEILQNEMNETLKKDTGIVRDAVAQLKIDMTAQINSSADSLDEAMQKLYEDGIKAVAGAIGNLQTQISSINSKTEALKAALSSESGELDALSKLRSEYDALKAQYAEEVPALLLDINSLRATVNTKGKCTVGEVFKENGKYYRTVNCDGTVFNVLVEREEND